MSDKTPINLYPFFDPLTDGKTMRYPVKGLLALSFGGIYVLLQFLSFPRGAEVATLHYWILGVIITTSVFALYVATDLFRRNVPLVNKVGDSEAASRGIIEGWLNDKYYLLSGAGFGTLSVMVGHILGIPVDYYVAPMALTMFYVGVFMAGFTAGMGLLGIVAVIVLYLQITPSLPHALDISNPDGLGGTKQLGDALWFFGGLILIVALLISFYLLTTDWRYPFGKLSRSLLTAWLMLPYVAAITVVLLPGLAVRRQIRHFKESRLVQLKQEKASLYSAFKQFDADDDNKLIARKREISERMIEVDRQLEQLQNLRVSHIDGVDGAQR